MNYAEHKDMFPDWRSDRWYTQMTAEMRQVWDDLGALFEDELRLCCEKYIAAYQAARISLPATTPEGSPVVHGARVAIAGIEKYWEQRLRLLFSAGFDPKLVRGLLSAHPDPIIQKLSRSL